jgi:hypothetical protein
VTCARGHSLSDPDNLYTRPNGKRECKTCSRRRSREFKERQSPAPPRPLGARRQKRRRKDAKLSRPQVRAAYTLYQAGMTTTTLAKSGYEQWGYATWKRAAIALSIAFRRDGYRLRDNREAQRLRWGTVDRPPARTTCAGCGCGLDDRSTGCDTCKARHWYRRRMTKAPRPAEADQGAMEEAA